MSDKNTSTLQATIDSVTGAAQSAIGALTGNTRDKVAGENKQAEGAAKKDASHATVKAGPVTASTSGATVNDPNRTEGTYNQTVGAGKEMLGNIAGSETLKQEGARQNEEGKAQEAEGQLKDLGTGVKDRVAGAVGGAVAGVAGDREAQVKAQQQHDAGKTKQRSVEADVQSKADA
jgi:uncharacterized protein YjbJ (UPF0337 family)